MQRLFNNYLILFFAIVFLSVAWKIKTSTPTPSLTISKQESAINFDSNLIQIFSTGQKRLIADLFWITTLLESDLNHYKNKDLNSWMFLRFKTISELDSQFLKNYQFGGQYLSIVKDDLQGAEILYRKGLHFFPNDYELNYNLGFLYGIELDEFKKAYDYFKRAYEIKKSPILKSLLIKFKYSQTSDLDLAYSLTKEFMEQTKDEVLKKKLFNDLLLIATEIDLKCLNGIYSKNTTCNTKNLKGMNYIKKGKQYVSPILLKKYQLHKR